MNTFSKNTFCILLFCICWSDANSQIFKHWGFWLADTSIGTSHLANSVTGFLCDKQDNIYIQQYNQYNNQDTLHITCWNKKGEEVWDKAYFDIDSNIERSNAQSKLYFWDNRLISISPCVINSTDYYFRFREINQSNGDIKKEWTIQVPYQVSTRANLSVSKDGKVFFIGDPINSPDYIVLVKFDLENLSSSYKEYYGVNNAFYGNVQPNICDVNDTLVALASTTWNGTNYTEVQCNIIRKSDLSTFSIHNDQTYYPWTMIATDDKINMFGVESYWQQDIYGNTSKVNTNIRSRYVSKYDDNFYYGHSTSNEIDAGKLDLNGNKIWTFQEPNKYVNIRNQAKYVHAGSACVINSYRSRYLSSEPWGDRYQLFGIKSTLLDSNGNYLNEYIHDFDTSKRQERLADFISISDSRGNPIILSTNYIRDEVDTTNNSQFTTTIQYLYKLCYDCDTTSPPIQEYENYINVIGNPVQNILNYNFGIVTYGRLSFSIHSSNGQIVYRKYFKRHKKGRYQKSLDLENLNLVSGNYILTMRTAYNRYSQKFTYVP